MKNTVFSVPNYLLFYLKTLIRIKNGWRIKIKVINLTMPAMIPTQNDDASKPFRRNTKYRRNKSKGMTAPITRPQFH